MKLARNAYVGRFIQRYEMVMIALYSLPVLIEGSGKLVQPLVLWLVQALRRGMKAKRA